MDGRTCRWNSSSLANPTCAPSTSRNTSANVHARCCGSGVVCSERVTRDMASLLELVIKAGEEGIDVGLVHDWTVADCAAQELPLHHADQTELVAQTMARSKTDEVVGAGASLVLRPAVEGFLRSYAVVVVHQVA